MRFLNSQILCVDGVSNSGDQIEAMLRIANLSYWVTKVETGEQALNRLAETSYDLCILDYALPDVTGAQLCDQMRQNGFNEPILFFTPLSRPVDRANAMASGADDYLVKPDDLDKLPHVVERLLAKRPAIYVNRMRNQLPPRAPLTTQ